MKTCTKCGIAKDVVDFNLRRASPDGLSYVCRMCSKADYASKRDHYQARQREKRPIRYAENRAEFLRKAKDYYSVNSERIKARQRAYVAANREAKRAADLAYRQANKERVLRVQAAYRAANKDAIRISGRARRKARMRALPVWRDRKAMLAFYQTADGLSMLTGEWYHVDHMVPLRGKGVCGLHCESNLQILTDAENKVKGNRWWPDMWESKL